MRSRMLHAGVAGLVGAAAVAAGAAVIQSDALTAFLVVAGALGAASLSLVALGAVVALRADLRAMQGRLDQLHDVAESQRLQGDRLRELREQQGRRHRTTTAGIAHLERTVAGRTERIEKILGDLERKLLPAQPPAVLKGEDLTTAGQRAMGQLSFGGSSPSVALLLQNFGASSVFAGIRTAVLTGGRLARELGLPLRVLVFDGADEPRETSLGSLTRILEEGGLGDVAAGVRLSVPSDPDIADHHPEDVWVATFWTTAWNVARLAADGLIRRHRVVYLVQDWEPSFYPWGDLNTKARSTYTAGFHLLVNSRSLARFVADQTGLELPEQIVFSPQLDTGSIHAAADRWKPDPDGRIRVLFYARPSKPRNLLGLGLETLRLWGERLPEGPRPLVRLAGENVGAVDLGPSIDVEICGKTSYDEYYDLLAATDVGLALMGSPHPGHLALELPMAGIPTVTNRFDSYRSTWVDGLLLADADPAALAGALEAAVAAHRSSPGHQPRDLGEDIGGSLESAVAHVAQQIRAGAR